MTPAAVHLRLGIEAAADWERYCAARSGDIAAHLGLCPRFVHAQRERNLPYWEMLERRWIREAFGPLAPLHLAARQDREDRAAIRASRRAARREQFAKGLDSRAAPRRPDRAEGNGMETRRPEGRSGHAGLLLRGAADSDRPRRDRAGILRRPLVPRRLQSLLRPAEYSLERTSPMTVLDIPP